MGVFTTATLLANSNGQAISGQNTTILTIDDDSTDTNPETTTVQATFQCNSAGTTTFTITQPPTGTPLASTTLTCTGGGGVVSGVEAALVSVTATPNVVPCGGGVTTITARSLFNDGTAASGLTNFHFSTDVGLLVQTSGNTARLTLGPGMLTANVEASFIKNTFDANGVITSSSVEKSNVIVTQACNTFATAVITADPNIVPCGGQAKITASARDANGHVVRGTGFHFTTDAGHLVVTPNNANTITGAATLTVFPEMTAATVKVSIGTAIGTIEGDVTVQQYCPGASRTAGTISLKSSADPVCGSAFIASTVRDVSNNPARDGTSVNFLVDRGTIQVVGVPAVAVSTPTTSGEETTSGASTAGGTAVAGSGIAHTTTGGTLNIVYTPPRDYVGPVRISAASGANFGYLDLIAGCGVLPIGTLGGFGVTAPSTGEGEFGGLQIRPPSTGEGVGGIHIRPPSTGDAGLASP